MREPHYETSSITRVRYEATPGKLLKVTAEATDLKDGDVSIFEVNLGKIARFQISGVEIAMSRKRGKFKDAPNQVVTWDSLWSGDAIVNALNGHGGLVKRVGAL